MTTRFVMTDWMGVAELPTVSKALRAIKRPFDAGSGDRVVVARDICKRSRLRSDGCHREGNLLRNAIPPTRERGFSPEKTETLFIKTRRDLPIIG